MRLILLLILIGGNQAFGQLSFSGNSNNTGRGTSVSNSIDYFCLNTNPSNLGWQSKYYKHKLSFKVIDITAYSASPVTARYLINTATDKNSLPPALIRESLESYKDNVPFDTLWTVDDRLETRDILTEQSSLKFNRVWFAGSYTSEHYGTFAVQVNTEFNASFKLSENIANLFVLGKINPYFDSLVLASGDVIANDRLNYSNDTLSQIVHAFSNDTLTIGQQLDGSYFKSIYSRNYSFGWGNSYKMLIPGWETYIGATVNFIEGIRYVDWHTKDNVFYLQDAGEQSQEHTKFSRKISNGVSVNLGMSFIKNDKFILGASINNLGFMHWQQRKFSRTMEYNSLDDSTMFNYPFGVSKDKPFYDQWAEANIFIKASENYSEGSTFNTATAANFSLGSHWKPYPFLSLSSDIILPLNPNAVGSYRIPYVAFGAELTNGAVGLSTGINNNFGAVNVPIGLTFGSLNSLVSFTIATNNILNYFQDNHLKINTVSAGCVVRLK